jgi:hypothetical protein
VHARDSIIPAKYENLTRPNEYFALVSCFKFEAYYKHKTIKITNKQTCSNPTEIKKQRIYINLCERNSPKPEPTINVYKTKNIACNEYMHIYAYRSIVLKIVIEIYPSIFSLN